MMNLDYIYDVIDAAKLDKTYDEANIRDLSDLHGVCPEYVRDDIICKRAHLEEVKKAKESLKVLKGELDKLG